MILSLVALVMMHGIASAQRLVSVKNYGTNWQKTMISLKNKPNGTIYRLRKENQNEYLPRVEEAKGLEQFISERIDIGWLAMYRLPMSDDNYKFIVVIYDKDEHPLYTVNLGEVAQNDYCEVQDVRWDPDTHNLLFNMACPSYASGVNGKGSKLHCYNPESRQMVWSTDWLTSNDIFILDSQFVFCSYGFTSEKKFLFMLDKLTGKVLSKLPFTYKIQYLELQTEPNGREYLYAVDYNDNLYKYQVQGAKAVADNGKIFTVCYAVSDDGYLNVRSEPSMQGKILGKLWMQDHGLGGGAWKVWEDINPYLEKYLKEKLGEAADLKVIASLNSYRIYLDKEYIAKKGLDYAQVKEAVVTFAKTAPHVVFAVDFEKIQTSSLPEPLRSKALLGYHPRRSGDILLFLEPGWYEFGKWSSPVGTTHGSWNPYDSHIPLVFYGWKVKHGSTSREVHITDIAPTVTQMLHIQQPNACVGEPIIEVTSEKE